MEVHLQEFLFQSELAQRGEGLLENRKTKCATGNPLCLTVVPHFFDGFKACPQQIIPVLRTLQVSLHRDCRPQVEPLMLIEAQGGEHLPLQVGLVSLDERGLHLPQEPFLLENLHGFALESRVKLFSEHHISTCIVQLQHERANELEVVLLLQD